jgi:molecular chaperone DnaK
MREIVHSDRPANIIGIDLGTTETRVARFSEIGLTERTKNSEGSLVTPSVIQIDEAGNVIIGSEAKKFLGTGTENVFAEFKREMGTDKSWIVGGTTITPVELTALLIRKVVADYEAQFGKHTAIAITWPANFRNEQRVATKDAARRAGLTNVFFIEAPIAVALCYAKEHNLEGTYLIYDFGGGTLDVTLIEIRGGDIRVRYQDGVQQLGGKDLDNAMLKIIGDKYRSMTGDEFDAVDCNFDKLAIESSKKSLSIRTSVQIRLVSAKHGPVALEVTRKEFESGISHLVSLAEMVCENVLLCGTDDPRQHIRKSDIAEIFMVGATSLVPAMQASVEKLFGKKPRLQFPHDACALGAAIFAAIRTSQTDLSSQQWAEIEKLNPKSLAPYFLGTSVLSEDGSGVYNDVVIRKGTGLPSRVERTYYTVRDNQTSVKCDMTQSAIEEKDPDFVSKLFVGTLTLPTGLPKGSAIKVVFTCDLEGCAGMQITLPEGGGPSAVFSANQAPTPPPLSDEHRP